MDSHNKGATRLNDEALLRLTRRFIKKTEQPLTFTTLPASDLVQVASFLSIEDAASLATSCQLLNMLGKKPVLWETRFERDFKDRYEVVKAEAAIDQAEEGAEESKASEPVVADPPTFDWYKAYRTAFQEKYGHLDKSDQLLVMAMMEGDLDALMQKITNGTLILDGLLLRYVTGNVALAGWLYKSSVSSKVVKFLFDMLVQPFYQRELTAEQQAEGLCPFNVTKVDGYGHTVLHYAAWLGQTEEVEKLIGFNADVGAISQRGSTALLLAAENGHEAVVAQLIAAGADVNVAQNHGWTALVLAAQNGHEAVVAQLMAAGADNNAIRQLGGLTALLLAAQNGHEAVVAQLMAAGTNVNAINSAGGTALMQAAKNGHEAIVAQLLAAGANVNTASNGGMTALMCAAKHGHEAVVAQLMAAGTNVNAINCAGGTALMDAADNGHEAIVVQLIAAEANVNAVTDEYGITALLLAVRRNHTAVIKNLIHAGAVIDSKTLPHIRKLLSNEEHAELRALQVSALKAFIKRRRSAPRQAPSFFSDVVSIFRYTEAEKVLAAEAYLLGLTDPCCSFDVDKFPAIQRGELGLIYQLYAPGDNSPAATASAAPG